MHGLQKTSLITIAGYTHERRLTMTTKEVWIFVGAGALLTGSVIALHQFNLKKDRALKEKKLENEKIYFDKLSPEQVELIETQKLELKAKEIELKKTQAELKKTVTDFKNDIHDQILEEVTKGIHDDMRDTFDSWSTKFEDRLDKKVDRVVSRIDDLSDKYGGVKATNSAPSINVVNAPNN